MFNLVPELQLMLLTIEILQKKKKLKCNSCGLMYFFKYIFLEI